MFNNVNKVFTGFKKFSDDIKIIYAYRYITLLLTSLFFVFCSSSSIAVKIVIISCLTVSSIILNKLYIICKNSKSMILYIILIEIVGNLLLLIPSGGLKSPFIWYALNTVLISLYYLKFIYCILNIFFYIIFSIALSRYVNNSINEGFIKMVRENTNFILGMFLVTAVAELLFITMKKLDKEKSQLIKANNELNNMNTRLEKSISCVMSLYQIIHSVVNESDEEKIIELITSYTRSLMGADTAFFCKFSVIDKCRLDVNGDCEEDEKKQIINIINLHFHMNKKTDKTIDFDMGKKWASCIFIKSENSTYGILGVLLDKFASNSNKYENNEQLRFLAEVGSMVFEKAKFEKIYMGLLLNGEQNRIADEIHDGVCQKLFSVSCNIQSILLKKGNMTQEEISDVLSSAGNLLSGAISELRETIYGMSSKKFGVNMFEEDIISYLEDIKRNHSIQVNFTISGEQDFLSYDIKRAIYRLICEGVANAVKHSQCSEIEINIKISNELTALVIQDNGKGFNSDNIFSKKVGGIGLKSMNNLTRFYSGQIRFDSHDGKGTKILVEFSNYRSEGKAV